MGARRGEARVPKAGRNLRTLLSLALGAASMGGTASAGEENPAGAPVFSCAVRSIQGGVSSNGTWYVFSAFCRAVEHRGKTSTLSVSTSYLPASRVFAEEIHASVEGSVWTARIRGTCPKDPWKNATGCQLTEASLSPNAPTRQTFDLHGYPVTAKLLTADQRSELGRLVPEAAPGRRGKRKEAEGFGPPLVLKPEARTVYTGEVFVRIRPALGSSESRYVLQWELQSGRTARWVERSVIPRYDAARAPQGLRIPFEDFGEPGMWRMRARPASKPQSWSAWVSFGLR